VERFPHTFRKALKNNKTLKSRRPCLTVKKDTEKIWKNIRYPVKIV
jgi:hypothetical protein